MSLDRSSSAVGAVSTEARERTREEDALDGGERHEALAEARAVVRDPLEGPVGLFADAGNCSWEPSVRNAVAADRETRLGKHALVSMALKSLLRSSGSRMYVSIRSE